MKTKPIWGTCAGAILLSQEVENAKKGGQELLGAMSITIARNGWGSQVFTIRLGESLFLISVDRSSHLRHPWKLRDSVSPNDLSMAFLSGHRWVLTVLIKHQQLMLSLYQVVLSLNPSPLDPPIVIISRISTSLLPSSQTLVPQDEDDTDPRDSRTVVALKQGRHLLTTFHPELTKDYRFHEYFVTECVIPSLSWWITGRICCMRIYNCSVVWCIQ